MQYFNTSPFEAVRHCIVELKKQVLPRFFKPFEFIKKLSNSKLVSSFILSFIMESLLIFLVFDLFCFLVPELLDLRDLLSTTLLL